MAEYLKNKKTGQLMGSIGDGKTKVPTVPETSGRTAEEPVEETTVTRIHNAYRASRVEETTPAPEPIIEYTPTMEDIRDCWDDHYQVPGRGAQFDRFLATFNLPASVTASSEEQVANDHANREATIAEVLDWIESEWSDVEEIANRTREHFASVDAPPRTSSESTLVREEPKGTPNEPCRWNNCGFKSTVWRRTPDSQTYIAVCGAHSEEGEAFNLKLNAAMRTSYRATT